MPQGVELNIPFEPRVSPDVARAAGHQFDWPRSFGLLGTEAAVARHRQGNFAELAGRFHPSATGAELDLALDQLSWFFLFDDAFDGQWGQTPAQAAQLVGAVLPALDGPAAAPPLAAAFADLWARSRAGMSQGWCRRAGANWRDYLLAQITEAANRCRPEQPTAARQLALRSVTIGVQPILDIAERLGRFELPEHLAEAAPLAALRRLASEIVALDNDIVSVEKEQAIGDLNLVLHFESTRDLSRGQAIEVLREMVAQRLAEFVDLGGGLADLAEGTAAREALRRYYADALCAVVRGAYDWEQTCARYRPDYLPSEAVPAQPRARES